MTVTATCSSTKAATASRRNTSLTPCARTGKRTVMRLWLSGAAVRAPMPTILPSLASTSACFPGCSCAAHAIPCTGRRSSSTPMTDWRDLLAAEVRQLEAEGGNPALTPKALALLRVIRGYERRVRQLALKSNYRVLQPLGHVSVTAG